MELMLCVGASCALASMALAFGAESRPGAPSKEEQLGSYGVVWELGGWPLEERHREARYERLVSQARATVPPFRVRLATVLRAVATRLDDGPNVRDCAICEAS